MRISTTTLESFRLFRAFDWMAEEDLLATIRGEFRPNHKMNLGQAFGAVLETPQPFRVVNGYRCQGFEFGDDVMGPALAVFDRRGVFEAKAVKRYGGHFVVAKADQMLGTKLIENKTTLSPFDYDKYADSYQWRFMTDLFEPTSITYNVFCLDEATNGVISLKGIESFNLFPYDAIRTDCEALVWDFVRFVESRGLTSYLERSGSGLEAA